MSLARGIPDDNIDTEALNEKITSFLRGPIDKPRSELEQLHLIENWMIENLQNVSKEEGRRILSSIADMNAMTNINYQPIN